MAVTFLENLQPLCVSFLKLQSNSAHKGWKYQLIFQFFCVLWSNFFIILWWWMRPLVLYFSLKLKGHYTFFSKKLWCQVKGLKIICFVALPREWNILRQEIMTLPWNTSSMHCRLMVKMLRQWWHKELCESITVPLFQFLTF